VQTQASFKALQASQENGTAEQLRAQIADLKNQVAVAEEARATAEKQRDETSAKLLEANKQIAAVEQQRDEAFARLKAGSETEQHAQALLAENGDLKQKLANSEKDVHELENDNSTNAEELVGVKQQVAQLQQQLAESQKQNQYLVARTAELWVQLDETGAQLQSAKLTGKNSEETVRLLRENELLRNIVVRERQEEARRDEARGLLLAELDKLKIKSEALNKEIQFLAQPVTKLSSEELSLLREPVVSVSGQNRGALTASFIFAKKSGGDSVEGEATTNNSGGLKGDVRDDPQSVAHATKESFSGASTGRKKALSGNPDQGSE
jgi:chromosome segregation ATPase